MLHELDGKKIAEGIYHNNIMTPVGSSIHYYQVRKKGETSNNDIRKQNETLLSRLFNTLTQRYGLSESLDGGNDNKEIATATTIRTIVWQRR